jgi:hypothetical protein
MKRQISVLERRSRCLSHMALLTPTPQLFSLTLASLAPIASSCKLHAISSRTGRGQPRTSLAPPITYLLLYLRNLCSVF